MTLKIKSVKTGETTEVSESRWALMSMDGRSRRFTVVGESPVIEEKPSKAKPKKQKIEIRPIESFQEQINEEKEKENEGTD